MKMKILLKINQNKMKNKLNRRNSLIFMKKMKKNMKKIMNMILKMNQFGMIMKNTNINLKINIIFTIKMINTIKIANILMINTI